MKKLSDIERFIQEVNEVHRVIEETKPTLGELEHILSLPDGDLSRIAHSEGCGPTAFASTSSNGGGWASVFGLPSAGVALLPLRQASDYGASSGGVELPNWEDEKDVSRKSG